MNHITVRRTDLEDEQRLLRGVVPDVEVVNMGVMSDSKLMKNISEANGKMISAVPQNLKRLAMKELCDSKFQLKNL